MYILTGLSWLMYWLLVKVFEHEQFKAALATAIIFILIGIVLEGYPLVVRRRP